MKPYNGAVFLDRDGTINEDVGYLSEPDGLILIDGAVEAIKRLNDLGIKVIVISNQSGVGRGYYTDEHVVAVNKRLAEMLRSGGAHLDAVYFCSHHPDIDCECRKPKLGMANKAILEFGIEAACSYVVGDKVSDVGVARNMNAKGVLVLTGQGSDEAKELSEHPDFIAKDLSEAVEWILKDLKRRRDCRLKG